MASINPMDTLFVQPSKASGNTKLKKLWRGITPRKPVAKDKRPTQATDYFGASDALTELDFEHDSVSRPNELWVPPRRTIRRLPAPDLGSIRPPSPSVPRTHNPIEDMDHMGRDYSWDARTLASNTSSSGTRYLEDMENETWEPEEFMSESDVPISPPVDEKWPAQFKRLLVRGSRYELSDMPQPTPRIRELPSPNRSEPSSRNVSAKFTKPSTNVRNPNNRNAGSRAVSGSRKPSGTAPADLSQMATATINSHAIQSVVMGWRHFSQKIKLLQPLEQLADLAPNWALAVVVLEILVVMYLLYQVSIVIETLALAIRSLCLPLIIAGKVLGYM